MLVRDDALPVHEHWAKALTLNMVVLYLPLSCPTWHSTLYLIIFWNPMFELSDRAHILTHILVPLAVTEELRKKLEKRRTTCEWPLLLVTTTSNRLPLLQAQATKPEHRPGSFPGRTRTYKKVLLWYLSAEPDSDPVWDWLPLDETEREARLCSRPSAYWLFFRWWENTPCVVGFPTFLRVM